MLGLIALAMVAKQLESKPAGVRRLSGVSNIGKETKHQQT